ncbi:MAG: D-alanyl-D-alanine carboxypeptidase/D-alanyl-D-alanine-endopeptidase [Ferruginibacter sp.]|nr:D-alanyl-D-alanine carboxypeptidase/D-alanyl-D-alanine-endopeptidase [Ferruginibacter sp.]
MMRYVLATAFCFVCFVSIAQNIEVKLSAAIKKMETDEQFKHAGISLFVVDGNTGKTVFDKNAETGLATASCLKVVTSVAAFELLGKNYTYKTSIGYDGEILNDTLIGNLIITASGDPTLGSWRWEDTKESFFGNWIISILNQNKIKTINGDIIINESKWETQATPGGWVWEDIGNYYGAGARGLNWHENQYDLLLKPGKNIGDPVEITGTEPLLHAELINELKTGKAGSGDNSIIYLPEDGLIGYVRGTVPAGNNSFKVSGAMPNASIAFSYYLEELFKQNNIALTGKTKSSTLFFIDKKILPVATKTIGSIFSPPLDSINYWFLQKSINLYGEAFVKTISFEKTGFGATDTGLNIITDFWSKRGVEKSALKIRDGSGLSPANRVTTKALVTVMQYAKKQNWFASFYNALPLQNGIRMKSGFIGGVRSYTGYIKSKAGKDYTFSFIINNYDGSSAAVREKMWKLLDILK